MCMSPRSLGAVAVPVRANAATVQSATRVTLRKHSAFLFGDESPLVHPEPIVPLSDMTSRTGPLAGRAT